MSYRDDDFEPMTAEEYYREAGFDDHDTVEDDLDPAFVAEATALLDALFGPLVMGDAPASPVPPPPSPDDILF